MKGVILAGGRGQRLAPLTDPLNKQLLPVFDAPLIVHGVRMLVESGIEEILMVLAWKHPGLFLEILEDGAAYGCSITYRYSSQVVGPGKSLLLAERWVGNEDFVLLLGDSMYFVSLLVADKRGPHMFVMPLDDFDDPAKYGQVTVDPNRVLSIVWKPSPRMSNLIQTTCFVFPPDAFGRLRGLSRSAVGEMPITALTTQYVNEGVMRYSILPKQSYIDCGTVEALHRAAARRSEQLTTMIAEGKERISVRAS